jgi:hypothetical protein
MDPCLHLKAFPFSFSLLFFPPALSAVYVVVVSESVWSKAQVESCTDIEK